MSPYSFITGCGLVTALGADLPSTWNAMVAGEYIRGNATAKLVSAHEGASHVAGLAAQAAKEAVANAGWSKEQLLDPSTAIIFGTSKGDIIDWIASCSKSDKTMAGWSQSVFGLARVCNEVCNLLGRPAGVRLTISAACASGLHALIRADLMIRSGQAERALVVAAEASVHSLFLASFSRLGILATGDEPGRPFDMHRSGFRMSEAAAAVTLERSTTGGVGVVFTAMTGDGHNIIAGDLNSHALKRMLSQVEGMGRIDVIHAHGTGTMLNDELEGAAIDSIFAGRHGPLALYSHKGMLGHSLGASGLVSVALAHAAHQRAELPPMTTTTRPIPLQCAYIHPAGKRKRIESSIILANGFGGHQTLIKLQTV